MPPPTHATPDAQITVALLGECMVELQGQAFGSLQQTFGGDTLNTAVYLARCGQAHRIRPAYATALGDDRLSAGMMTRWAAEGIGLDLVRRLPGRMPGLYMIEVDERGERSFSYWRDQSAARAYFDTDAASEPTPLEQAAPGLQALYLSGISLAILPPAGRHRALALMARLREQGARVVFDNNYRPRLWPDVATARACYAQALAVADLALVTLDDHQALLGGVDEDTALADLAALRCAELVVKRGARPTLLRSAPGQPLADWLQAATEPVAQVVDTTAAGDSFAAGYLARRLTGEAPLAAARFGNRLAARVIQHRGAVIPAAAMADLLASA